MTGFGIGVMKKEREKRLTTLYKTTSSTAASQFLQLDFYKLLEELGEGRVYDVTMAVLQFFDKIL
jgi:hypothetical protein